MSRSESTPGDLLQADPPWEPPLAGTEAEHLRGSLERMRATFRFKAEGLTAEQLRSRPLPSTELTVGGLLKHLAVCEDDQFQWRMSGRAPVTWLKAPEGRERQWMFTMGPDETAEGTYALWDEAVARSRTRFEELMAAGGPDAPGHLQAEDGTRASVRRHLHDLIEEYSRHTGHLDLLREAIDGRVGEDPPPSWRFPG